MATKTSGCTKREEQGSEAAGPVVPETHARLWTPDADELIVHDRENADAWIQSPNAVDLRRWA